MRKSRLKQGREALSTGIITGAVLLCIALSFLGFLKNREAQQAAARSAAQTAARLGQASGSVLQLSDPLLVLVNDWTPLPEDWLVTPRMVHDEVVDARMYDDLMDMFDTAGQENIWFWVASGYRSVGEQEDVLARAVAENRKAGMTGEQAEAEALKTIQRPGCSEHHTGLAVDLNDVSDSFEETDAYRWLTLHAAEYGFVQRYCGEKAEFTGIENESWHYRYVGKRHAREMTRLDMCLEEYIEYLRKMGYR